MLRPDLVQKVTDRVLKKDDASPRDKQLIKSAIYAVFDVIVEACMHGDQVVVSQFGKFFPKKMPAQLINNGLRKDKEYTVPERMKLRFKSSGTADRYLNQGLQRFMAMAKSQVDEVERNAE